jgi:hypothetical protein
MSLANQKHWNLIIKLSNTFAEVSQYTTFYVTKLQSCFFKGNALQQTNNFIMQIYAIKERICIGNNCKCCRLQQKNKINTEHHTTSWH